MGITREKLYEEVWAEPMTKVAARYNVSSSFLARICKRSDCAAPSTRLLGQACSWQGVAETRSAGGGSGR